MTPRRIQRKRTKGWRMPANTVCVSRPGKWGNPYRLLPHEDTPENRRKVVNEYADDLRCGLLGVTLDDVRRELRGKNLACFCPEGMPCHGDVLLEIAGSDE